ncbi:MAG: phasin family protein [Acidobacteria bacterium]|nr:phasin family protein [Acidobacteriota bacterium]
MSDETKNQDEPKASIPNPLEIFGEMYRETLKQSAAQWEETARSPLFMALMANNVEQTMQLQRQMQEMVATAVRALNLPSKEDFLALSEKIDRLAAQLAALDARLGGAAAGEKSGEAKKRRKDGKKKM